MEEVYEIQHVLHEWALDQFGNSDIAEKVVLCLY